VGVMGLPRDTLRTTTYSHHIPPTLYNLTLVKYSRNLAEYGKSLAEYNRTLRVAVDGILLHIAAYYPHIAVVGRT